MPTVSKPSMRIPTCTSNHEKKQMTLELPSQKSWGYYPTPSSLGIKLQISIDPFAGGSLLLTNVTVLVATFGRCRCCLA